MKLRVDYSVCTGHGRCAAVAPDLFFLDEDGKCGVTEVDVPEALIKQGSMAVNNCPERAISEVN